MEWLPVAEIDVGWMLKQKCEMSSNFVPDVKQLMQTAIVEVPLFGASTLEDMVMCDGCDTWFHW